MKKMCYSKQKRGTYPTRLRTPMLVKPQENLGHHTTIICRHSITSLQGQVIQPKFQRILRSKIAGPSPTIAS